ncbi:hypothetical protein [Agrobacterium tumefaciens]|uniref:hypothetical protein n=1 Tax=Agrobacterium tumefaciens TaxID=358 RepID=UPI0015731379|nr:hypothetical protein [Agrobacterium tumefaciens]NTD84257.1 hypothetical protein [Agrobacterium tumefaciens]NTD94573.1 hypothetical protein [Agrobacterium tumefaciens]NTD96025.1 hypothetical protein [Agrobacterium tumefaciens]NTE13883.1 hypothetical protein [Agrobacterium tumefaciens]NTE19498.1 hypothetical protein [Agrobacterium tumefaciens]
MSSAGSKLNREKRRRAATYRRGYEDGVAAKGALSAAEPVKQEENPMRFFADNVDNWGALEWFNRLTDACEDHDRKRTQAFRCTDPDEKDMLSLSADTSKMIMSSSALHLAREHKDEIRSALSAQAQAQDVACQTCNGTGKEARHQICRDCDESTADVWQLVPIEPSAGMIAAAKSTTSAVLTRSHATEIYRAMIAAAPTNQEGGK